MYDYFSGKAVELSPTHVVVDVNGIGFFIRIPLTTFEYLQGKNPIKIYTEFIVREDGHFLYGFHTRDQREIFRMLISVSGIGSSSALLILSSLTVDQIKDAIASEDIATLKSIKGIGPKTAKRLVVELKDKILKSHTPAPQNAGLSTQKFDEAASALEVLGYPRRTTEKLLLSLLREQPEMNVEEIIKTALKRL